LDIAEYLVEKGANIHGADKQQKSPLIKACINGQDHIVALLLRRGVNANFCDLSENTALHYACAYGWLDIAKLLVEKGNADVNRLNEWKSSPTIIAMLKGHFGIVDYLLSCKGINASLVDD
jgi:ankyrin repeat protein